MVDATEKKGGGRRGHLWELPARGAAYGLTPRPRRQCGELKLQPGSAGHRHWPEDLGKALGLCVCLSPFPRLEINAGFARRCRFTAEQKMGILAELMQPGASMNHVARRNRLSPSLIFVGSAWPAADLVDRQLS